jgi:molecular chaperone GrpE
LHDDDPPEGPEGRAQDPLADLLAPAESSVPVGDASAAEAFQKRAKLAEDRLAEVLTAYRQVKTENEGFRERITRNLERRFDQRRERLLLKFIEILDNLDRALEATEQTYTGTPMIEGIILVRTQLLSVLKEEGLERIPVLGLAYDPSVAEAVETRPVAEPEHHHVVVKELLRGYRLNGRVARAARVAIGEYRPDAGPAAEDAGLLVGADEVPPSKGGRPATAEEAAEEPAVHGLDAALDDLLTRAEPAAAPQPPASPKKKTPPREIDLLKEVLDEDDPS